MFFAVLREEPPETRVALVPEHIRLMRAQGHAVGVETGAGAGAQYPDAAYVEAGATVFPDRAALLAQAEVLLTLAVTPATAWPGLRAGMVVIGLLAPLRQPAVMAALAARGLASFSLDALPRISRAQSMDVLSAMSTVSGYRAVIVAAERVGRFLPLLMTAAGTIAPARVLVLGAGVAGLQAVATAHRLGAVVQAFDARPAVQEQVASLGATFLTLPTVTAEGTGGYARAVGAEEEAAEQAFLAEPVRQADIVITTAMVPGQRAPQLITAAMVAAMHPGAVIMDLAAEAGGNTAVTVPGQVSTHHGVVIDGTTDWPAQMPRPASQLYSRAIGTFVRHLLDQGLAAGPAPAALTLPAASDAIVAATGITREGQVVHAATAARLPAGAAVPDRGSAGPDPDAGREIRS